MLIHSVIIILQEVFEAALIGSVLLALCRTLTISRGFFIPALFVAGLAASLYAINIVSIMGWFDGVGQEVLNSVLYGLIFIAIVSLFMSIGQARSSYAVSLSMSLCLIAAVVREGSEIIIYLQGFWGDSALIQSVVVGGFIGAGIGFSIGVFFYYLIVSLSVLNSLRICVGILILISAGMVSQTIQFLMQADLLISQAPLWDSSWWVTESSVVGAILSALIGYESTPTPIQVTAYIISLLISSSLALRSIRVYLKKSSIEHT